MTYIGKIEKEKLTQILSHAGLVLIVFELVKGLITKPIRMFYSNVRFGPGLPFHSYAEDVLSRHKHEFEACLMYLRDFMESISQDDMDAIRLVLGWKRLGFECRFDARIVSYADDLVICCRSQAEEALAALRQLATRIGLTVNEDKTHVCRLPQGRFDFLGYSFARCYSEKTGRSYLGSRPSRKSIQRMVASISAQTERKTLCLDADIVVARLNRMLTGWANYFCLGPVSKSYRAVNAHATQRLSRWLCKKHKISGNGKTRFPEKYLHETLGLVYLPALTRNLPWAKA